MKKSIKTEEGKIITRYLVENDRDFDLMLNRTKGSIKISFDTENGNGDIKDGALNPKYAIPAGFSIAVDDLTGYYVPINHKDIKTNLHLRFKELFINKKLIIFWNSVYDGAISTKHYSESLEQFKWYDCMIAQHLIDARNSKSLKKNTERYFGVKQDEFVWKDANNVKALDIYTYACDDAIYTFKHYLRTKENIKEEKLDKLLINIEGEFLKVLVHLKLNGITFDVEGCKNLERDLFNKKKELVSEILKCTKEIKVQKTLLGDSLPTINLESSHQLKILLYDKLNMPVNKKTPTGAPAVDNEALKTMVDSKGDYLHPIVCLLLDLKEAQKMLSAFTKSLYEKAIEGKIYGDLLDHGTESGRLSARSPNLQQLPKNDKYRIRGLFKSSPGYKMMVADFSQEELRIAGVVTGAPAFFDAYKNNKDLHLKTANECFGLNIPEEYLIKTNPKYKQYEERFHKDRFNAKSINFGLLYGRTAYGLAPQLKCSPDEAQKIVDTYFETFPQVRKAKEKTVRDIYKKGYVRNLFGRKRRFTKMSNNGNTFYPQSCFREGFNTLIQGSAADVLRVVMIELYKYIKEVGNDQVRMLTTVHDEIMFEIKDDSSFDKRVKDIIHIMENSVKFPIKLEADYNVGYDYAECK